LHFQMHHFSAPLIHPIEPFYFCQPHFHCHWIVGWPNMHGAQSQQGDQCFETRTGPAGRPGTRPTRAWDRSGSKQKPVWELARWNPVDPAGRPGTWATRANPAETRPPFFIYTKTSNDEDERCIIVAIANRDKT